MDNSRLRKPEWLRKKIRFSDHVEMKNLLDEIGLHTICEEAMCPNISECFRHKVATFMILGTRCTRTCSFCAVDKGKPFPPDPSEPRRIADAVQRLGLRHVVITSPARDDLPDGGADHFSAVVKAILDDNPETAVELLIPDMQEKDASLMRVARSGAVIIGHNLETVPRLYHVRRGAEYLRSLRVLDKLSSFNPDIETKSGIMLGLGEDDDEVLSLMRDLREVGCSYLSIGQYLSPSSLHERVVEYVAPERFEYLGSAGKEMGFAYVHSSPYTRSSYMAHLYQERK